MFNSSNNLKRTLSISVVFLFFIADISYAAALRVPMNITGRSKAVLDLDRLIKILAPWLESCRKDEASGIISFFPEKVMALPVNKSIPQPIIVPDGEIKEAAKLFWEMVISARKHPRGVSVVPISIKVGEDIGNVLKEEALGLRKRTGAKKTSARLASNSGLIGLDNVVKNLVKVSRKNTIAVGVNRNGIVTYALKAEVDNTIENVTWNVAGKLKHPGQETVIFIRNSHVKNKAFSINSGTKVRDIRQIFIQNFSENGNEKVLASGQTINVKVGDKTFGLTSAETAELDEIYQKWDREGGVVIMSLGLAKIIAPQEVEDLKSLGLWDAKLRVYNGKIEVPFNTEAFGIVEDIIQQAKSIFARQSIVGTAL